MDSERFLTGYSNGSKKSSSTASFCSKSKPAAAFISYYYPGKACLGEFASFSLRLTMLSFFCLGSAKKSFWSVDSTWSPVNS